MTEDSESSQDEGLFDGKRRTSLSRSLRHRIPPLSEMSKVPEKWDIFSAIQNLPSALNDPSHRETDLFTKTWGDGFIPHASLPPSTLPTIELADFLRYLKETSAGRKSHRRIMRELDKGNGAPPTSPQSPAPIKLVQEGGRQYDLNNIPKVFNQKDFSLEDPRTFLQIIPLPRILPQKEAENSPGGSTTILQSTKLPHEKLTHHLDVIEVHLAHQISLKSDVFFSTLASQRQLELLIMQVRKDVVKVRNQIDKLGKCHAHPTIKICGLRRQQIRLSAVCQKLSRIATIHHTQHTIQLLLRTSDFVGALELISKTQSVLFNELGGVSSLRHLSSQLAEMEKAIDSLMESDFINVTCNDLESRVAEFERAGSPEGVDTEIQLESIVKGLLRRRKIQFLSSLGEKLVRLSRSKVKEVVEKHLHVTDSGSEDGTVDESEDVGLSLGDRMRAMSFTSWFNLLDHTFSALLQYMHCVEKTLAVISRTCQEVAGVLDPLTPTPVNTPTRPHLHAFSNSIDTNSSNEKVPEVVLEGEEFEGVVDQEADDRLDQLMMEDGLSDAHIEALALSTEEKQKDDEEGGVGGVVTADEGVEKKENGNIKQTMSSEGGVRGVVTAAECQELLFQCQEILSQVCDILHSRCTKILNIRAKDGLLDDLVASDFVKLVRTVGRFVGSSAGVTGRPCPHLRYALLSQAKKFLESFHDTRKNKLNILLDGERWRQSDVPPEIQKVTRQLEDGVFSSERSSEGPIPPPHPPLSSQNSVCAEQYLVIHNQKFPVVSILLILIKMISDYCMIVDDLPMLVTDILGRLVDTLKFFNSRTCQLVLGAGAVELVGLKTITTRHLALVFRCLQVVMLLIPDIKAHFRKKLTPKKCVLLLQFDQALEDIGTHCREINHKIVTIMEELFIRVLSKWEVKSPTPSQNFRVIIKQILKLHENLCDILPPDHLHPLFQGIEDVFKSHMISHLSKLGITNNGSTEHGVVNAELTNMKGSLEALEHITAFGSSLFDIWTINR